MERMGSELGSGSGCLGKMETGVRGNLEVGMEMLFTVGNGCEVIWMKTCETEELFGCRDARENLLRVIRKILG